MRNLEGEQTRGVYREDYSRRRGKELATSAPHASDEVMPPKHDKVQQYTPPTIPYGGAGPSRFRPATPDVDRGTSTPANQSQQHHDPMASTPWGLWSAAGKEKKDLRVAHGSMSATMDDTRRHKINEHMRGKQHTDFGRKAWMQSDRSSIAWVIACPKEHDSLNAGQFPVVCQTYFGVPQTCLEGLKGHHILQKFGRKGRRSRETECDVYGENLVKATLPSGGWTYHHNGINM